MRFSTTTASLLLGGLCAATTTSASSRDGPNPAPQARSLSRRQQQGSGSRSSSTLWVTQVPSSPQPYAVRHYGIPGVAVGAQVYRFPVTGPSSGGAFTLISTAAPSSGYLGVLPHLHRAHYENFFCLKGRFQLWTADADTFAAEEARLLTAGDYGAVPPGVAHTFQIQDLDTDITGVIQPGGFEDLFYALATANHTPATLSPYEYAAPANAYDAAGSSPSAAVLAALESFDVYAQLGFAPSRALVNGSYSAAGSAAAAAWHVGGTADALAADAQTPYYVGKDNGPKYLSAEAGFYQIVQPLVTPAQSAGNFTMATIIVSEKLANESAMSVAGSGNGTGTAASRESGPSGAGCGCAAKYTASSAALAGHCAFEVLEGLFSFRMGGETIHMATGDVVFVPAGTAFQYYSSVPFSKVLLVSQGDDGLDTRLIANGEAGWEYTTWPDYAP